MESDHTRKIETPPTIAQSGNGKGAYVIFRTRFKGKHRNVFYEVVDLAQQIRALPDVDASIAEAQELSSQLREKKALLTEAYTHLILDWNWANDEGEPLPRPTVLGVIEGELYQDQERWINEQLRLLFKERATEGKKTSGTTSLDG